MKSRLRLHSGGYRKTHDRRRYRRP